jgi:hypothetical protein
LFDLQFVHHLFWLKLKWNARSKLFNCIIYRQDMICRQIDIWSFLRVRSRVILVLLFQILIFPFIKAFLRFIFFLPETRIYITQIWVITICVVLDHNTVIHLKITGMQNSNQDIIFTCPFRSDSCSFISNIDISVH